MTKLKQYMISLKQEADYSSMPQKLRNLALAKGLREHFAMFSFMEAIKVMDIACVPEFAAAIKEMPEVVDVWPSKVPLRQDFVDFALRATRR